MEVWMQIEDNIQEARASLIMAGKAMGCRVRHPDDYKEHDRCIALQSATLPRIVIEKGEEYVIERDMRAYDAAHLLRMGLIVMLPRTAFDQVRMNRATFDWLLAVVGIRRHPLAVGA
jgi:hypothetical protein